MNQYLVTCYGGELDGQKFLLPQVPSYWYFRLANGLWASYGLTWKHAKVKTLPELVKDRRQNVAVQVSSRKKKKKNQLESQGSYTFEPRVKLREESNCDVQTFITWHRGKFGIDPSPERYND